MARRRLTLTMPGSAADAFEAFHNHEKRLRWDTLLSSAQVEGGGTHPYVGAITANTGRGWMRGLSMRTRFVSYRPRSWRRRQRSAPPDRSRSGPRRCTTGTPRPASRN